MLLMMNWRIVAPDGGVTLSQAQLGARRQAPLFFIAFVVAGVALTWFACKRARKMKDI